MVGQLVEEEADNKRFIFSFVLFIKTIINRNSYLQQKKTTKQNLINFNKLENTTIPSVILNHQISPSL